jgi:hypothetical protein
MISVLQTQLERNNGKQKKAFGANRKRLAERP